MALAHERCVACRADSPRLTEVELSQLQPEAPDWQLVERNNIKQLERILKCKDFVQALTLTNRIGELAEQEGHHPRLVTEWGRVTVTWWTHKIRGLHRNDFIMAAKTDKIYSQFLQSSQA